ncbi:MAG: 2,3-bisphosphoglycerate-independent phosphoglycerate mutase [Candidatus Magasanikbacteria bacterium]
MTNHPKPVVLAILDGWGIAPDSAGNAITRAKTPNYDKFVREYPAMTLHASGNEVGLSFGEMGNSEVGHLNIGAGRVYYQTLPRINKAVSDGSFFENKSFVKAAEHIHKHKSSLHLTGLIGSGHVHANEEHCYALLEFAKKQKIKNVFLHIILDGRDSVYNGGIDAVKRLQAMMKKHKVGEIATLSGRYYSLDRDNRWERTEKSYRAMVQGISDTYEKDPVDAIEKSYEKKVYDEEFVPIVIGKEGKPATTIQSKDAVIFFNFRPDRARQLTKAFVLPGFEKFQREYIKDLYFVTMTEYEKEIPVDVAYPPVVVHNSLAETISKAGLSQYHVAEVTKYAHMTFFLNGTVEDPFPKEERMIVPSANVSSFDQKPDMSAPEITKAVVKAIEDEKYDAIMFNFANCDMVGHTGNLKATIKGIETIDKGLGKIVDYVLAKDGVMLITADHGNGEEVINLQTGEMDKEHSTNPVPFIIIGREYKGQAGPTGDTPDGDLSLLRPVGVLADVAPTMLKILGVEQPQEMTGRALV